MNDLYIHSVYDSDNWSKLSINNTLDNIKENSIKRNNFRKASLFSTANNFRQSYLLRYYILKNSLIQNSSFIFHNSDNVDAKEIILSRSGRILTDCFEEIDIDKSKFLIHSIKSLLGTDKKATLFGMLIKNEDSELLLEDPTYKVKLEININNTFFGKGIYCLNHMVVVRGKMNSLTNSFEVELLFHPPTQNIDENLSRNIIDKSVSLAINTFNTNEKKSTPLESKIMIPLTQTNTRYSKLEETNISENCSEKIESWIVLSDLLLTSNQVITNLEKVFSGYEQAICGSKTKLGFILFGNFIGVEENFTEKTEDTNSKLNKKLNLIDMKENNETNKLFFDFGSENNNENSNSLLTFEITRKYFNELKVLLNKFPTLKNNCIFLIIPGPNDIGPDLLPKNPLIDYFTSNITQEFPNNNIYLKSSPSRLNDNGNSIFLMRHSLSVELKEKTIYSYFGEDNMGHTKYWNMDSKILEQIIPPTILGQKHVTPTSSNIIPTLDASFYLFPTPNVIIIGDSGPSYSVKPIDNVWIVNPGSFKDTNSWIQYNVVDNSIDHVWL
ncbi:DNA polymerase epsilon subunit [Cryptosporidium xiaoi]|uniref:DNA polymerase II subunit 2 n=1 Tax=Cryptosporidium xiaoi TaxID=659607 RepID=A0AAV9Y294_9CRYT